MASPRLFDLNIETVLEHWEPFHAVREIIANALDETILTSSPDIQIRKDSAGVWHVTDSGRGLCIEHLTLNENEEKLGSSLGVIGKFGVGLKDALATFHRHGIGVEIASRHGTFRLQQAGKHGFETIHTLHVAYYHGVAISEGTDIRLAGLSDRDMDRAKSLFLVFAGDTVLETTSLGDVLQPPSAGDPRVYINGVLASEEPNFLFSYNITSLTETMKKRLNRERLNVGRSTYTDRVKAILRAAASESIRGRLAAQVRGRSAGTQADELQWIEIAQVALTYLQERAEVAYVTEQELHAHPDILASMRSDGREIVVVTDHHKTKLTAQLDTGGPFVRTLEAYVDEYNASFSYEFVSPSSLSDDERRVFALAPALWDLVAQEDQVVPEIRISETLRLGPDDTQGVWDQAAQMIVIRRDQLQSPFRFASTLLHEFAHATSGFVDATRQFESVLTRYLGLTSVRALGKREDVHA